MMSPEVMHWHAPFWHMVLPRSGQVFPQRPQLPGSELVFVQYPLQFVFSLGHWQAPFWQVIPLVQPHWLQL
jgi:hypothetical protein